MFGGLTVRSLLTTCAIALQTASLVSANGHYVPKFEVADAASLINAEYVAGIENALQIDLDISSVLLDFENGMIHDETHPLLPVIIPNYDSMSFVRLHTKTNVIYSHPCSDSAVELIQYVIMTQQIKTKAIKNNDDAYSKVGCAYFDLTEIPYLFDPEKQVKDVVDGKLSIAVRAVWVDIVTPLPAKVDVGENQRVVVEVPPYLNFPTVKIIGGISGNIKFPTLKPLEVGVRKSSFTLGDDPVDVSFSPGFTVHDKLAEFSFVSSGDVSELATRSLYLHFEYPAPIMIAESLHRVVDISHLTDIATITDNFVVHNRAAEYKTPFSRIDYMKELYKYSLTARMVNTRLPLSAYNIDFRDDIGNVSTSNVFAKPDYLQLSIQPRYPVSGGWQYKFYQSYQVPLSELLQKDSTSNTYVAAIPISPNVTGLPIKHVKFEVILPQGNKHLSVSSLDTKDIRYSSRSSFFDTTGRTVVELEVNNVISNDLYAPVAISYSYTALYVFVEKVLTVSIAVFCLFLIPIFVSRIDLSTAWKNVPVSKVKDN